MRKEIKRSRKLPAFKIDLADVGSLYNKITELFGADLSYLSITVSLKNQKYQFDSIAEIYECEELPDQIKSFSLYARGADKILSFGLGYSDMAASVTAESQSEAWCAGAIEVVYQFIQQHRRWYSSIRGWPLGALVFITFLLPSITKYILGISAFNSPQVFISWLVFTGVITTLYIKRGQLLPNSIIQITSKDNIVRRYLPELTLTAAILGLVFTVISWFIGTDA